MHHAYIYIYIYICMNKYNVRRKVDENTLFYRLVFPGELLQVRCFWLTIY